MELLQLFDVNMNPINGFVERDKVKLLEEGKYFIIVLIFIQNHRGEFLIQKTSINKGGVYATTGGHVSYKYSPLQTALKEIKEELGIDLEESELSYVDALTGKRAHMITYFCKKDIELEDIVLEEQEVASVEWLDVSKIIKLIDEGNFRSTNIEPFKKVLKYIEDRSR